MSERINHPDHYKAGNYECIEVMKEIFGEDAVKDFCKLNAFKYLWRSDRKNGNEDLLKAKWYLDTYLLSELLNDDDPYTEDEDDDEDWNDPDPEEDEEEIPNYSDTLCKITQGLKDVFSKTAENIRDFANPNGDHRKRIEYFKKLKAEGFSEDVAYYFSAFKPLPEDKDEQ